jgi:hypothetical protein
MWWCTLYRTIFNFVNCNRHSMNRSPTYARSEATLPPTHLRLAIRFQALYEKELSAPILRFGVLLR